MKADRIRFFRKKGMALVLALLASLCLGSVPVAAAEIEQFDENAQQQSSFVGATNEPMKDEESYFLGNNSLDEGNESDLQDVASETREQILPDVAEEENATQPEEQKPTNSQENNLQAEKSKKDNVENANVTWSEEKEPAIAQDVAAQPEKVVETNVDKEKAEAVEEPVLQVQAEKKGWQTENGKKYYYQNNKAVTGQRKIDGYWYMFDPARGGAMVIGWYDHTNQTNPKGGPKRCYYDAQGHMLYGQKKIDGYWYMFHPSSGAMIKGFYNHTNATNPKGGPKTCYYDGQGHMLYGQRKIDGYWYMFHPSSGAMIKGWYNHTNETNPKGGPKKVYYDAKGHMLYGDQKIDGKWYYFHTSSGALQEKVETKIANLKVAAEANQLIIVKANGTRAEVSMYQKNTNGTWKNLLSVNGYVGQKGVGKAREGSATTPRGAYHILKAFGIKADPGSGIGYTKVDSTHYYVGDPYSKYYNKFVSTRTVTAFDKSYGEHLIDFGRAYNYILDFDYNPNGTPHAGSCFFLHCSTGRPTGGCISVPEETMVQILRTIRPGCMIVIDNGDRVYTY